ncbi:MULTISPECIES: LAGLIDADG family homing endonuclease [unclassified Methylophaga]|jgi:hypothetical protein|uniref:LAGLIDADG family homing endonuclease n=1 Tax=unclassified Methylophaga TaxID=2629249 RepID=UPI000C91EAC9|nr:MULTISPECIES: LAGLIDADG family homing endonuclease [unclassified Methylophaga]MAK67573.1 hypothetical protein [Methylophaga sp.]MAY18807.1 hypothetical protein [Methylophaga sp.]HCD05043.1 hypothetical protein [Methylophaga sp.]|tara:strand:+ start:447 stop:884 length:438 start_codon:yes stop_codon:yes gene_type:complete
MAIYKTTKQLTPPIAAYIAGLIDGEGTITLCRKHKNENRQLAVSISSTEKYLLEYVLEVVGAGKITTKKTVKTHHSPSFTYAIYNRQALSLLEQISPYLQTYKKYRSRLILKDYLRLTPRNGKYNEDLRAAKQDFEFQLLNILPR